MPYEKIGPIEIITGENNSHVPYCTSLLIHGRNNNALIDCGGGKAAFDYIQNVGIDELYLTHYHIDHIWGAHLFPLARKFINPYDLKKINDPTELAKASGYYALFGKEGAEREVEKQLGKPQGEQPKPRWKPVIGVAEETYPFDKKIEIAGTTMHVLHTPGHTEGFCCPYFPEHGVLFAGDFDLTSFGPWYNDSDSDIDAFFDSAERTLEVDAKYYVTAHHKGTFERVEYEKRLRTYMDKIREREEKTKFAVQQGVHPKEIVYREIFYFIKNHRRNPVLMASEILGIAKHLRHLIKEGRPFEGYFREFIACHGLHEEWIDHQSDPVQDW
ncbi:MAG TPA: MBL fold metallo-hydrolase [Bacillales bacterium]|nr:MBL fold metallo-hydrolase [Bacillales bacterium]